MYKNKTILGLITARGGSKGIPRKNIRSFAGKPLISWTIEAALTSKYLDFLTLSSDDKEIIDISATFGCGSHVLRPAILASDTASSVDVVLHALDVIKKKYDYLLLLQPTSPFRTSAQIDSIIEETIDQGWDLQVSVTKLKKHPRFFYEIVDGTLRSFLPSTEQLRRQDMPAAYEHNGALYLVETDFFRETKTFNSPVARPYIMDSRTSLDIDDLDDWEYGEYLVKKGRDK